MPKQNNARSANLNPTPHRGVGHLLSLLITMTAAFFLGLVILSILFFRGV